MSELRIVPTFHLRGIVPSNLLKRYKEKSFPAFPQNKVNISVTNIKVLPKLSLDTGEESFIFVDKSGTKNTFTTTNQASFTAWKDRKASAPQVPCSWCRHAVGEKPVYTPIAVISDDLYAGDIPSCNYNCCYAALKRDIGINFFTRDPLYKDSEHILKYLFEQEHPGKDLRPAIDWRLLDINGGPLTYEEFAKSSLYTRGVNVIVPVKVCYSKN